MYEAGTGVVQNYQKAAAWYRKAAEQDNSKQGEPMQQTKTPLTDEEQAKLKLLKITDEKLTGVTDKCKLIGSLVIPDRVTEIGRFAFTDIKSRCALYRYKRISKELVNRLPQQYTR